MVSSGYDLLLPTTPSNGRSWRSQTPDDLNTSRVDTSRDFVALPDDLDTGTVDTSVSH